MARKLKSGEKPAQSGRAKSLVIFLHGYGADGADLLSLADVLGPHLPDTAFAAPDAPDAVPGAPYGRQWFAIPRFDGSTEARAQAGLAASTADLTAYLAERAAALGLPLSAVALVGFSQGAMMALNTAPTLAEPLAGVVAIAGRLVRPEAPAAAVSRPPILLIHGDRDEMVPFENLNLAGQALTSAGFQVFAHVMTGSGHGIAPDGLQVTLDFLARVLPA